MNMEKIICNVLVFTIITSVLKGLIIKDEYKQYFQFFCGLIMILIVITPFIDFLSSDNDYYDILQKNIYSLEIKDSIGSIKTADGKMRDVLVRQCESKIEGQIKKMAQKDGVDCKIEEQRQDNACGNSPGHQIPLDKAFCRADVLIDRVDLLAARVFLPHLLHVDILHQLVERQAKVVAQQHQPLKVGVGLRRLPL